MPGGENNEQHKKRDLGGKFDAQISSEESSEQKTAGIKANAQQLIDDINVKRKRDSDLLSGKQLQSWKTAETAVL